MAFEVFSLFVLTLLIRISISYSTFIVIPICATSHFTIISGIKVKVLATIAITVQRHSILRTGTKHITGYAFITVSRVPVTEFIKIRGIKMISVFSVVIPVNRFSAGCRIWIHSAHNPLRSKRTVPFTYFIIKSGIKMRSA